MSCLLTARGGRRSWLGRGRSMIEETGDQDMAWIGECSVEKWCAVSADEGCVKKSRRGTCTVAGVGGEGRRGGW